MKKCPNCKIEMIEVDIDLGKEYLITGSKWHCTKCGLFMKG